MTSVEQRLDELERRVRDAEDRLEITQLIAGFGPIVDTLSRSLADMWEHDGVYATQHRVFRGSTELAELVDSEMHQGFVSKGCAHVMSLPVITLSGDTAFAIGYSNVFVRDGDHWRVERASSNRWQLVRTTSGWRVRRRDNHLLDGSPEGREVLAGLG